MVFQFVKTNILSKKLRNFLTIFSILISVMLIISVGNLMYQLKNNVIENDKWNDEMNNTKYYENVFNDTNNTTDK